MRFGSVCSGIEAASVAWHPLGWQAAWLAEIEPFPSAVLQHHYPEVPNLGDMTALPQRIRAGEVEAPDLFCGGTPCQAFSVAGLRQSLSDDRGNLSLVFVEIANAIDSVRSVRREAPSIVFWENVPGVLSTKDNAFGCFLGALAGCDTAIVPRGRWTDAGVVAGPQRTVAWRTLDAQYFGLAQRRKRVFVVASAREGFDPAAVLLEREGMRRDSAPSREAGKVAPTIPSRSTGGGGLGTDFDLDGGIVGTIGCNTGPRGHGFGDFLNNQAVDAGHLVAFGGNRTSGSIDVTPALLAQPGSGWKGDFESETFITQTYAKTHKPASTTDAEGWSPVEASPTITHWFRDRSDTGTDVAVVQSIGVTLHGTDGTQSVASYTDLSSSLRARIPSGVENSTTTAVLQPVHRDLAPTLTSNYGKQPDSSDTSQGPMLVPVLQPVHRDLAPTLPVGVFQDSEFGVQQYDSAGTLRAGRIPEHQMVLQPVVQAFTSDGVVADPISANEGRTYTHEGTTFRLHNCVGMPEVQAKDVVALQDVRDVNKAQNGRGWNDDGTAYTVDTHATQGVAVTQPYTLAIRGRGDSHNLEYRQDGTANALLTPNGGRGGIGVGAIAHADSHANGGGQMAVAFQPGNLSRGAGSPPSGEVFPTLKSDHGRGLSDQQPHVMQAMQVRRLTPRECERLQGFPDDYTAIPWRGKPASECPDGPRYKALGNSWAVPVVRWIGARIQRNLT